MTPQAIPARGRTCRRLATTHPSITVGSGRKRSVCVRGAQPSDGPMRHELRSIVRSEMNACHQNEESPRSGTQRAVSQRRRVARRGSPCNLWHRVRARPQVSARENICPRRLAARAPHHRGRLTDARRGAARREPMKDSPRLYGRSRSSRGALIPFIPRIWASLCICGWSISFEWPPSPRKPSRCAMWFYG